MDAVPHASEELTRSEDNCGFDAFDLCSEAFLARTLFLSRLPTRGCEVCSASRKARAVAEHNDGLLLFALNSSTRCCPCG